MAWIQDRLYSFNIVRLVEGFLNINTLTISAAGYSWDLIVGGVDQAITPAIHPGEVVSLSMTVRNDGEEADDFRILTSGSAPIPSETSGTIPLAVGASSTYGPATFTMPDADISYAIETQHFEEY